MGWDLVFVLLIKIDTRKTHNLITGMKTILIDINSSVTISVEPDPNGDGTPPEKATSYIYLQEGDGIKIDQDGRLAKFSVNAGDGLKVNNGEGGDGKLVADTVGLTVADGKVTAPDEADKKKLVNAGDLSSALNELGWKVSAGGTTSTVKSGNEVEFKGDGVTVTNTTDETGKHIVTIKAEQPQGGAAGEKGADGKSAYDIWKAKDGNANKSEADFLASLKGDKGEAGTVDTDGTTINVTGGKVSAVTGAIENNAGNAKAKNGDGAKLTTVANVADAINAAKTVVTNADNTTNVNLDKDGKTYKVAARVADDKGLEKTDSGLVVKAGNGVEVGSDGVGVKTKKNGGIIVDKDGLSVDLPFTRTEGPDGTMVTFKGNPAVDRPNGEVRIGGVAAGMVTPTSTDAVNGSQLYAVGSRVDRLQDKVDKLGKRADAGVAGALATANLLQPHHPGQSVATAAVGNHNGQTAIAVGYATMSDNGKYGMRFSFGANTQRDVSLGAGLGYFW
ncbi:YadA family autotransporter adhesin [Neisseria cinerea]|uniref:YadA family autotransporter adhesin n=1 Tax=Neisseria cinerea TaxID=483 RepID=UPI001E5B4D02|nr:YadA-like family protein [Neisseria cinerea]MCD2070186.1 YadA-like family protein [Neisseria cinerea]